MHTFTETAAGVPAFLAKLWRLVEDPETNNLICWSKDGRSFIIQNQAQFARELLPLNYKHNNMASFIRQLNMYGFHKITSLDNGCLKFDRDEMEFTHPCFKRNCPYLLEHIKRKLASTKSVDEKSALKPEAVTKVLHDVKAMRGRQDSLDSRFSVMKQENEALWREIASLRQKHAKQQQIVNKLIQFLITIVQPQRNMTSVKRHMQLMINDTPDKINVPKPDDSETKCGPVIHELGEDLMDEASEGESELVVPNTQFVRVTTPGASIVEPEFVHSPHNLERPPSSGSTISQSFDFSNQDAESEGELINETPTGIAINDGLIQTVNNDGSQIFFHITEVPDAQPTEGNNSPAIYNDDNVLTTPMVREEIARTKLLKEKNRQRRNKNISVAENTVQKGSPSNTNTMLKKKRQNNVNEVPQALPVKSEDDSRIDPILFLDAYRGLAEDPHLISPNFNEHSPSRTDNDFLGNNNSDLYNPNNFITDDIPTDIFEDDALTGIDKNSNIGENRDLKNNQQQQFVNSNVNSGKFSKYSLRSASENDQQLPSTSAAAAVNSLSNNNGNDNDDGTKSVESTVKCENFDGMALAKFKNNQDIMRLSTPDEVSGHLGVVQDELEGLKDLLRSDTYSLDSNTLLGLFNDTDIFAPYTLNLNNDENDSNDKKGALATYQPVYDLSDIINDQNDLDAESNIPTTSTLPSLRQTPEYSSSVLNTPYHQ